MGEATLWAAAAPAAAGEIFNLSNGEVFEWRDTWPALATVLGVETGPDQQFSLATYFEERDDLWKDIVARHNLVEPDLDRILGQSHKYADFHFAHGARKAPPPALTSTVKVMQAGFAGAIDTETSICHGLGILIEQRIIPDNG